MLKLSNNTFKFFFNEKERKHSSPTFVSWLNRQKFITFKASHLSQSALHYTVYVPVNYTLLKGKRWVWGIWRHHSSCIYVGYWIVFCVTCCCPVYRLAQEYSSGLRPPKLQCKEVGIYSWYSLFLAVNVL